MPYSTPTLYVVHRDSQKDADAIAAHLESVHRLILDASRECRDAYFGLDICRSPRPLSRTERDRAFNDELAVAVYETPEVSIDPARLARAVRDRIDAEPRIEVQLTRTVVAVGEAGDRLDVVAEGRDGRSRDRFDHVVNALWDGRLAVDASMGLRPGRPWLYRFRYGIRARPDPRASRPPTTTMALGAFGEVVNCTDGSLYLMWYPATLVGTSGALVPPDWPMHPGAEKSAELLADSLRALAEIILPLREFDPAAMTDLSVKGGIIVAWGETDIDDPRSELHRRFEIGVTTSGRYHSVDPGKLTMVPYFAGVCADRIRPS
jgi:hypothetical protein